ncbi:chemotaxis protein CheW [Sedimentibacter sp.]|uniref:chemotaxis protein CheW n=1 Tax=Sedimentibacter sp. TaxID=1960295 RepID=UPI0028990ED8|nr:chemotaxis protein CheW [Sedimentibacter sp.]
MNSILSDTKAVNDTQKGKYLTFYIGNDVYGIAIKHVKEIIGIQPYTEIPQLEKYVRGVINLRGNIIPLMDVRLKFNMPFKEYDNRTCIIVININGISLGIIVDCVLEVLAIADENISLPPSFKVENQHLINGIGKVGDEIKLLIDCSKLISDDGINNLMENMWN